MRVKRFRRAGRRRLFSSVVVVIVMMMMMMILTTTATLMIIILHGPTKTTTTITTPPPPSKQANRFCGYVVLCCVRMARKMLSVCPKRAFEIKSHRYLLTMCHRNVGVLARVRSIQAT